MMSTRIYWRWRWTGNYEFYIDTGRKHDSSLLETSLMITINIFGGGKISNKRGRLKKRLMSPPSGFLIGTGEVWCHLNEKEKKHYIELEPNEFKKLLETYDISEVRIL